MILILKPISFLIVYEKGGRVNSHIDGNAPTAGRPQMPKRGRRTAGPGDIRSILKLKILELVVHILG